MKTLFLTFSLLSFICIKSQEQEDNQLVLQIFSNKNETAKLKKTYKMIIEPVFISKNYNECMGIALNQQNNSIFFATNGKFLHKFNHNNSKAAELLSTIKEVTNTWNDDNGDTFLHDIRFNNDGFIYAVAENCILKINSETGNYSTIIKDKFIGPWGAYGIELDKTGNIFVGDHHGGIHVYLKNQNWEKVTIVAPIIDNGKKRSFGGIVISGNELHYLDFENSKLYTCTLESNNGIPEAIHKNSLSLPLPYPEYLQIWKGDIFIKAARENKMLRIRDNKVIQTIGFESTEEVSPIVTFVFDIVSENKAIFYGVSWGPNGTLYKGELDW